LEAASQAVETSSEPAAGKETSTETAATAGSDLDRLRETVCAALETSGHNTAAVLLSSGTWTEAGGTVQVEVRVKKTMLGLTMNADAEKIVRSAAREAGFSQAIAVVSAPNGSAENGAPAPPPKRPAAAGSLQAEALAHPLVKQALELFNGEIRSVLDLREKRNA
jgi:DNA polymerase-3 subunit gamma/tau